MVISLPYVLLRTIASKANAIAIGCADYQGDNDPRLVDPALCTAEFNEASGIISIHQGKRWVGDLTLSYFIGVQ